MEAEKRGGGKAAWREKEAREWLEERKEKEAPAKLFSAALFFFLFFFFHDGAWEREKEEEEEKEPLCFVGWREGGRLCPEGEERKEEEKEEDGGASSSSSNSLSLARDEAAERKEMGRWLGGVLVEDVFLPFPFAACLFVCLYMPERTGVS